MQKKPRHNGKASPVPQVPPLCDGEQTSQSGRFSGDTLTTSKNLNQSRNLTLRQKLSKN